MRIVDAWGKERWGRIDAQGQLVEVVEPNPQGDGKVLTGGMSTRYSYDTLGNLTLRHTGRTATHL
jgi:YD repeat-containing protein